MTEELKNRATNLIEKLDADGKRRAMRELEAESMKEGFWSDAKEGAKKMKRIAELGKEIEETEMLELLLSEGDEKELEKEIHKKEFALYLSGPYDQGDAILALHAGQGGTEAMDWTSMLFRMYTRFCELKGWSVSEVDFTPGDEAGIKV